MPQFVRLVNTDPTPFDFHHNNIKKIVPGGGDTIVPWAVACTLFGDPTLVDTPRDPARANSLKQARGTWNYMLGMERDEEFDARRPHIEVWDVEQSPMARIYMLIEDPEGTRENIGLSTQANMTDIQILQNQVAVLTQHLANLTARQQQANQAQRPDGQTIIPSTDAAPSASFTPSPSIATDERGKVQTMNPNLMAQLNLTPEQVAIVQAHQMAEVMAEAAIKSDPMQAMQQFINQGITADQWPDDTAEDINRIPPPPIAANDPMYADSELGDLQLVGAAVSQSPAPQATVDGPPQSTPAARTLPPRPGH